MGYEAKFRDMTWGWQAGVGLDIWKLSFDIDYEGSFESYGNHFTLNGVNYSFSKGASRWIASIGIRF